VEELMIGRPIHIEISFSLGMIPQEQAVRFFAKHPTEHLFFGTDSPWADQKATLDWLRSFDLDDQAMEAITHGNAERILGP
jgi:predicted TIM-barrel fold metal-dependent hydrolase